MKKNKQKFEENLEKKVSLLEKDLKPLTQEFYNRDVVTLAKELVGKIIVRKLPDGKMIKVMIVETEAYKAPDDKACHAYNNKKTDRTKYFWTDGGHLYIFSIYGSNNCMNIVAADKTKPEAVLLRAVEPLEGLDIIKSNRKINTKKIKDLTNGPAKLTKAIQIDKTFNGYDMTQSDANIYLTENTEYKFDVVVSKRINIDYAEEWIEKPWRFYIKDNDFVTVKLKDDKLFKDL